MNILIVFFSVEMLIEVKLVIDTAAQGNFFNDILRCTVVLPAM